MLNDEAMARARGALRSNQPHNAIAILLGAAEAVHLPARDYDEQLRLLAEALGHIGALRAAATAWLYLREPQRMAQISVNEPRDLARAAHMAGNHGLAAQQYRAARWPAHAAVACERAGQFATARAHWEDVSADPRLRDDPYTGALVSFNLGRVLARLADGVGAHKCRVRATRLLEEAADMLEARGLRDRAFDCFQVLLTLGAETGSFENLAEGSINCIRILKEDHLKYYALQYYEDFVSRAERAGEHHAVATILHEASDYARRLGLSFHTTLRVREAEAWRKAAEASLSSGGSVELAENALLAAVGAYSSVGMHARAVALFGKLSSLAKMEEKRSKRYRSLAEKYEKAQDETARLGPLPEYLRQPVAYPDIWNVDVISWEEQGDAVETCGEILIDEKISDFVRRKALLARLVPLTSTDPNSGATLAQLAERLGAVQLYAVLSPLERMYDSPQPEVRVSVLHAAGQLYFKRTFTLVMRGVIDPGPFVLSAAIDAIGALRFPHAFDPLSRLHRDSVDPAVRQAALGSIGRIFSLEAVEYLIGTMVHGTPRERVQAADLLTRNEASETNQAIQSALVNDTSAETARELQRILRLRSR